MSLCHDFSKWIMITLASVVISLTVGIVLMQFAHGQCSYKDINGFCVEDITNQTTVEDITNHDPTTASCQTVDNQTTNSGQTVDNQTHALTNFDNSDFSIDIPDNWAHVRGIYSQVGLTPNEFGELLVNAFEGLNEELKDGGAYAEFRYSWYYPIENAPFDVFVKYELDKNFHGFKITCNQNVTIDNEPAVKIYADGIATEYSTDYTGIKSVLYLIWHDEKPYRLEYTASVKDFEKYLPQFEQMVKSFKFKNELG